MSLQIRNCRRPDTLSADALALYTQLRVSSRGVFAGRPADDPELLELVDANLVGATWSDEMDQWYGGLSRQLHPLYSPALIDAQPSSLSVEVTAIDPDLGDDGELLATLHNAEYRMHDRGYRGYRGDTATLMSHHPTITDEDHDRILLGRVELANPQVTAVRPWGIEVAAVITSARLYLDGDTPQVDESVTCTSENCTPHTFGPYSAPADPRLAALRGTLVAAKICMNPAGQ